jgi:tellurite resistance protein
MSFARRSRMATSIAVDQTKLRRMVQSILAGHRLNQHEATTVLRIAQLAAGSDHVEEPAEHSVLQAIAQQVYSLVGVEPDEVSAIPPLDDHDARISWFRAVASQLDCRAARELAFAMAFLVSVSDLKLEPAEHESLEELQLVLGVDDRRATDLVVHLTAILANR